MQLLSKLLSLKKVEQEPRSYSKASLKGFTEKRKKKNKKKKTQRFATAASLSYSSILTDPQINDLKSLW